MSSAPMEVKEVKHYTVQKAMLHVLQEEKLLQVPVRKQLKKVCVCVCVCVCVMACGCGVFKCM
jgi:hypothetical protein